eukprot:7389582-Prymnesium_polylepis.2
MPGCQARASASASVRPARVPALTRLTSSETFGSTQQPCDEPASFSLVFGWSRLVGGNPLISAGTRPREPAPSREPAHTHPPSRARVARAWMKTSSRAEERGASAARATALAVLGVRCRYATPVRGSHGFDETEGVTVTRPRVSRDLGNDERETDGTVITQRAVP